MAPRSDTVFLRGLEIFSEVVAALSPADWDRPSPCAGWRALDVLGHIGNAVRFGTALLSGQRPVFEPHDPPGELVEGDPAAWWEAIAGPAREAVSGADLDEVVDTPMGRRTVDAGLAFPALDLFVHAWDLGRIAGVEVTIPEDVIEFAKSRLAEAPADMLRSPQVFGPEVAAPPDATPSEAFLAWTGRDPRAPIGT